MSPSRYVLSLLVSSVALFSAACGGAVQEESASEPAGVHAQATEDTRSAAFIPPDWCTASVYCESLGRNLSCSGFNRSCRKEGAQNSKVCGGVTCDGKTQWCPPLPGDLECY